MECSLGHKYTSRSKLFITVNFPDLRVEFRKSLPDIFIKIHITELETHFPLRRCEIFEKSETRVKWIIKISNEFEAHFPDFQQTYGIFPYLARVSYKNDALVRNWSDLSFICRHMRSAKKGDSHETTTIKSFKGIQLYTDCHKRH